MFNSRADKIWYVYELVDPRNSSVFYVGKGIGNRMYYHGKASDKTNKEKINTINEIGYTDVIRRKIAEFWDESAAYECETDRIKSYKSLTNISKSNKPRIKYVSFFECISGCMSMDGEKQKYNLERLKIYFNRDLLPSNEYVSLYDAACRIALV